ncbi:MAG: prolyl-tRNA editing protein [Rhodothalassiaceae bacterium]|nr:MAG: prolyl-tRNA editing protein [Rhodothalassiaceae bacterium]
MAEVAADGDLIARGMAPAVAAALGARAHLVRAVRAFARSCRSAGEAAALLGIGPERVVKSLVFMRRRDEPDEEPLLLLAPGHRRVDEARLARALGAPVRPARAKEVKAATGFEIGAVAPVGHARPLPAYIDAALLAHDVVWASAGTVRAMMALGPRDLLAVTGAQPLDLG